MAKKEWTPREFELALKAKLKESVPSVVWGRKRKRPTTIGAIFVPGAQTRSSSRRTLFDIWAEDLAKDEEFLEELAQISREEQEEEPTEDQQNDAHPI